MKVLRGLCLAIPVLVSTFSFIPPVAAQSASSSSAGSEFLTLCGGGTGALPSPFQRNGADIYYTAINGRVGIGTSTPQAELDVNGTIRARGLQLDGPVQYVTYEIAPATTTRTVGAAVTRYVSLGYARSVPGGNWETRLILRQLDATDPSPLGENSNTVCDTGYLTITGSNFSPTTCVVPDLSGTPVPVISYFVAPFGEHRFPVLRVGSYVRSGATFAPATCSQYTLDTPFSDRLTAQGAASALCTGAGRMEFAAINATTIVNGVLAGYAPPDSIVAGEGVRADAVSARRVCQIAGYTGYVNYAVSTYNSCSNNALYFWNGTIFARTGACGQPGRFSDTVICFRMVP